MALENEIEEMKELIKTQKNKKILNEENGKITELQGEINNLKIKLDEKQHTINILLSEINILEEERLKNK